MSDDEAKEDELQLTDSAVKLPSSAVGITVARKSGSNLSLSLGILFHHHEDIRARYESAPIEGRFDILKMSHSFVHVRSICIAQQTAVENKPFFRSD
jgi:hypothetical protein